MTSETFKEYISPTSINEASMLGWKYDSDDDETAKDIDRDKSPALGLMAYHIMEAMGNGCGLDEVLYSGDLIASQDQIGINKVDIEDVRNYLSLLKDHPLVKEMELALESRNEYEITKPFGEYILYGRLDKVIKTAEGWKILDFKFSRSESHSEAHDFQMKFYLYLAREIFSPLLGAELFYLKDGISRLVLLGDENIPNFQEYLDERIEEYQRAFKVNLE